MGARRRGESLVSDLLLDSSWGDMLGLLAAGTGVRMGSCVARRGAVPLIRHSRCVPDDVRKRSAFLGSRAGVNLMAADPVAYSALGEIAKDAEGAVKLYDEWADTYDLTLASWGYDAPQKTVELVEQHLDVDASHAKVLDVGCGTGLTGRALSQQGFASPKFGM